MAAKNPSVVDKSLVGGDSNTVSGIAWSPKGEPRPQTAPILVVLFFSWQEFDVFYLFFCVGMGRGGRHARAVENGEHVRVGGQAGLTLT